MNIKIFLSRLFIATVLVGIIVADFQVCRADLNHLYTDITGTSVSPGLDDSGGSYTASPRDFEVPRRNPEIFDPSETQFGYDSNGNTVKDLSRNIEKMCYNPINLPLSAWLVEGTDALTGAKTRRSVGYTYADTWDKRAWYFQDLIIHDRTDIFACHIENMIRAEHSLPLRTHYGLSKWRLNEANRVVWGGISLYYGPANYKNPFKL